MRFAAAASWTLCFLDRAGDAAVSELLGLDRDADYAGAEREHPELLALVVPEDWARPRGLQLPEEAHVKWARPDGMAWRMRSVPSTVSIGP